MRGVRPYLDAVRWPRLISQEEPGVRGLPIPIDGLGGDVQDIGCFVHGQAAKESQLDNLAHASIERRQAAERIAERNEVVLLQVWQLVHVIEIHVKALDRDPQHNFAREVLGGAYWKMGDLARAGELLSNSTAYAELGIEGFKLAVECAEAGDLDAAFEHLQRLIDARDPALIHLAVAPQWDSLRADPRFNQCLARMKLQPVGAVSRPMPESR